MKKWGLWVVATIIAILAVELLLFSAFPILIEKAEKLWSISTQGNHMNTACVAAGALFTAFAFGATFYAIREQHQESNKQKANALRATTLNVFTHTFNELQNSDMFIKAQEYVLYKLKQDINAIKSGKSLDDSQIGTREINDYSKNGYKYLMHFLTKMDYMGIIVKKEYIDEIIFDYFGKIIIDSYLNLERILMTDRYRIIDDSNNRDEANTYFIHYYYLFNEAKKRKPDFVKESRYYCDNLEWPKKGVLTDGRE